MDGVSWKYDGNKFTDFKNEITHLFSFRNVIPGVGLQYYPFCELINDEWFINRHFFFRGMFDTTGVDLRKVMSYNNKMSVQDWISLPVTYDLYVLEIISDILLKYDVGNVEFCGLHEYNISYTYDKANKR